MVKRLLGVILSVLVIVLAGISVLALSGVNELSDFDRSPENVTAYKTSMRNNINIINNTNIVSNTNIANNINNSDNADISLKQELSDKITNIAVFGLDRQGVSDAPRSDCIMILSIDEATKTIKLSSIMRDTYVKVQGHGMTKLAHAYAFGGPVLAMQTLNENFGLNIKDYIAVDFFELEKLIDTLGGVTVNVMPDEIQDINKNMNGIGSLGKKKVTPVTSSGTQVLSGMQAVAYCRVRHTEGDDYRRTERQREVMQDILEKLFTVNTVNYPKVALNLLPKVETSLNIPKALKLAFSIHNEGIENIEKERFPLDSCSSGKTIDGIWYLVTDLNATKEQMYKYIYENKKP